ncbi:helix-turn-helix domain-containing protein [Sphaerotilus hippei]|uniref:helix-turn-helix domain-containing protein n=1 Tax=Sphaerotilus hippei TaxID=744406 RepID=UPI001FEBA84E|nr:helix-turn-helix domain-containing protein [Sphaerotilus hippei]
MPRFALYGEAVQAGAELLHIEPIQSRSRLHDWEIDAHVHQGLHQVIWLRAGPVEAILDECRTQTQGPALIVIPPGVAHAFRFSPASDGHVLTLHASLLAEGDATDAGDALQTLFAAPRTLAFEADAPDVARLQVLFEALQAEAAAPDSADGPVPRWLARSVVWRLARLGERQAQAAVQPGVAGRRSIYTRWVVLMEAHHLEHWPVSRYAERLGMSTERLNRMVRAETGSNVQALLHARLMREACRRLVHVAAPVSSLAFELGFEDPAYFCRFFKRHSGLSPRAYRARLQRGAGPAEG